MISKGHDLLLGEALRVFSMKYPNITLGRIEDLKKGMIDPDYMDKPLGSHYALYDEKTHEYHNRIKSKKINAYTLLIENYEKALKDNDIYRLGFALHFVTDMLTIPHAIGLTDAKIRTFFTKPHRKYEIYTADNMSKYYKDVTIDEDFYMKNIKEIMEKQVTIINSFRNKVKKQYYDEINETMIPVIITYLVGFLFRYTKERM